MCEIDLSKKLVRFFPIDDCRLKIFIFLKDGKLNPEAFFTRKKKDLKIIDNETSFYDVDGFKNEEEIWDFVPKTGISIKNLVAFGILDKAKVKEYIKTLGDERAEYIPSKFEIENTEDRHCSIMWKDVGDGFCSKKKIYGTKLIYLMGENIYCKNKINKKK